MSLTYLEHCFGPFDGDIVHLNQNKRYKQLILASSQGDYCIILNVKDKTVLAQTPKFQDSVTQALWVSPNFFLVSSLDGTLRLFKYEINEQLQEISCLDNLDQLAGFYINGRYVYAYTENCDVYVVKYDIPTAPELVYTVTCTDLKEVQPIEQGFVAIGSEIIQFNINSMEEKRITLNNEVQSQYQPTASYYDEKRKLLFIGYNNGVTEVFLLSNQTYKHAHQLAGITEAEVTIIKRYSTVQLNTEHIYYYVGTNDGLYCYEHNFQLRTMIHLRDQGVSALEVANYTNSSSQSNYGAYLTQINNKNHENCVIGNAQADHSRHSNSSISFSAGRTQFLSHCTLLCGLTDGRLLVVDPLNLQEICRLDILVAQDEAGEELKPILSIVHFQEQNQCLITGDNFIYIYPDNFEQIGREQKRNEDEISFHGNENTEEQLIE